MTSSKYSRYVNADYLLNKEMSARPSVKIIAKLADNEKHSRFVNLATFVVLNIL
jgi:hypothetical protein